LSLWWIVARCAAVTLRGAVEWLELPGRPTL
jgi:hypothetical protein